MKREMCDLKVHIDRGWSSIARILLTHQEKNIRLCKNFFLADVFAAHFFDSVCFEHIVSDKISTKSFNNATEDLIDCGVFRFIRNLSGRIN